MALTNQSKPVTSLVNSSKVSIGETWATITTTWASEIRTWLDVSQLFDNVAKVTQGSLWSENSYPWLESSPWDNVYTGLTNQAKP